MIDRFVVAVSAGALLDGMDEGDGLRPGLAFDFIKKLYECNPHSTMPIEILVVSRQSPAVGGRVLRFLSSAGITQSIGCFVGDDDVIDYVIGSKASLFISRNENDVQRAVDLGIPAACLRGVRQSNPSEKMKIVFDGDAVLFSSESEKFYVENGRDEFFARENANASKPLPAGPMMPFLQGLTKLSKIAGTVPFEVILLTARSGPASARPITTLDSFDVKLDRAIFCGDLPKKGFLEAIRPDIFFDDSDRHVDPASEFMPVGKVPWLSS